MSSPTRSPNGAVLACGGGATAALCGLTCAAICSIIRSMKRTCKLCGVWIRATGRWFKTRVGYFCETCTTKRTDEVIEALRKG